MIAPELTAAKTFFKKIFGYPAARVVRASGRVELLGNYSEPHQGLAIHSAVHRGVAIALAPRHDGRITVASSEFPGVDESWLSGLEGPSEQPWSLPFKSVLWSLQEHGAHFSGFDAAIFSNLPSGVGLGSSSAVQVATALAVRELYPYRLTDQGVTVPPRRDHHDHLPPLSARERMPLARLCVRAAARFSKRSQSLFDFLSILHGEANCAVALDGRFGSVDLLPLIGEVLVFCDTGEGRQWLEQRVAALLAVGRSAAARLGAKSLRSMEMSDLKSSRDRLDSREFSCAYQAVSELQRVVFAERSLREDDHFQFGQYLNQSHHCSREHLRNSTEMLDRYSTEAMAHPSCLGARLTGAGYGGGIIALVRHHEADLFVKDFVQAIGGYSGKDPKPPLILQIARGIR